MSPNIAYFGDHDIKILNHLEEYYQKALSKRRKHSKYKLDDKVRVLYQRTMGSVARKGYKQTYSDEIFKIGKVDARLPFFRYHIKDGNNKLITGSFLQHELSLVNDRSTNSSTASRSGRDSDTERDSREFNHPSGSKRNISWIDLDGRHRNTNYQPNIQMPIEQESSTDSS